MGQPLWQGTYKLWQDEKFAHEFARATGAKIFHLDGILVYVSSRKGLGYICASIYNPEVKSLTGTSFFKLVEGFLRKNKIAKAVIYTNQNINPKLTGISVTPMATLVLDLEKPEDEIFKNAETRFRTAVKKGAKNGLIFKETTATEDFDKWWEIYYCSLGDRNIELLGREFILGLWCKKIGRLFVVVKDEKVIAGAFLLFDGYPVYYLGALDNSCRKLSPNNYLHWQIIRLLKKESYKCYDLGGASLLGKKHGSTFFKMSFGANYVKGNIYTLYNLFSLKGFLMMLFFNFKGKQR